jgi:type IV secretion system protein VirB10
MQHDDAIDPPLEMPAAPPREPTSSMTRKRGPSRLGKVVWPLSLALAAVLVYGAISPDDKKSVAHAEEPEPLRPAPRAVHVPPAAPEPVFTPVSTVVPKAAAVPPLPPQTALPPVDPDAAGGADRKAEAAEAARLRRKAPLMVEVGGGQASKVALSTPADAESLVVQDMMLTPARRETLVAAASSPAVAAPGTPAVATVSEARLGGPVVFEDASALERQILQGKTIPAVLETPIHTDLPGSLRAMVDEDVYAEAGRQVMIPKMSRLIGEYRKDVRPGQSRVLVVWQRVLLPDGTSLRLMSPGTDGLGRAGMAGDVDNHFLERFGAAFLVSMIGVVAENASQQNRSMSNGSVVVWGGESKSVALEGLNSTVESVLKSQVDIPPTIQVPQGSRVRVFVARDLDLSKSPEGR